MISWICSFFFDRSGWRFVSHVPEDLKKFVIIGAPHTSNWDFWLALTFFQKSNSNGKFTIKKQWLKFPFKKIFLALGAVGIDRETISSGKHLDLTSYMASLFDDKDEFIMMITLEGTRSPVEKWKTGFYYTAKKANVPIVLAYGDYKKKELGMSKVIYPSDYQKDMKTIIEFYRTVTPKNPENFHKEITY